jgi:hypothetical protein
MRRPRIIKSELKRKDVFEYLKRCAGEHRTVSYKEVGNAVGLYYRVLRFPLFWIWGRCNQQGLPELNAIVVNSKTGKPGPGCPDLAGNWEDVRDKVFAFAWDSITFKQFIN